MATTTSHRLRSSSSHPGVYYALLVTLAALPFVATRNLWGQWFVTSALAVLLCVWLILRLRTAPVWPTVFRDYRWLLALLAMTWVYLLLKLVPLPGGVVALLSPEAARVSGAAEQLVGATGWRSLSVDWGLGLRGFLQFSGYLALFLLVLVTVTDVRRARLMATVVAVVVGVHGLWGLFGHFVLSKGRGRTEGLFGDPNLFAVFIEIGLAVAVGLYLGVSRRGTHCGQWRTRLVHWIDVLMSSRGLVVALVLVLFTALFASGSRGGAVAAVASIGIATVIHQRREKAGKALHVAVVLVMVALASLVWFGGQVVLERLEVTDLGSSARPSIWRSAMAMVGDYSATGIGAGAWRFAYPGYREPELGGYWLPTGAHNAYLQVLVEHGIVGFLLLGSAVLLAVVRLTTALRERHDSFIRGVLFGSLTAVFSLLLHSLFEGAFQTFTSTAYFYAVLALGLATVRLPREGSSRR